MRLADLIPHVRFPTAARNSGVRIALLLVLFPIAGQCAALAPDALSLFQQPGVAEATYEKVERGVPLTLADVVALSKTDVSGGAIIDYLYTYGEHFNLTPADVGELRSEGVRPNLIDYMESTSAHPRPFLW